MNNKVRRRCAYKEKTNPEKYREHFTSYYEGFVSRIDGIDRESNLGTDVSREFRMISRQGKLTGICC